MAEQIDFSEKLKHLTDDERKYVDYCLATKSLPESDLEMIFGIQQLEMMRSNIVLRRLISDMKLDQLIRQNVSKDLKAKELLKILPLSIETLVDVMQNGKENNRLQAAQFVAGPAIRYLDRKLGSLADLELVQDEEESMSSDVGNIESKVLKSLLTGGRRPE